MPEIGKIRVATEVGHRGDHKYIWSACADCGRERWVALAKGEPNRLRCRSCANKLKHYLRG